MLAYGRQVYEELHDAGEHVGVPQGDRVLSDVKKGRHQGRNDDDADDVGGRVQRQYGSERQVADPVPEKKDDAAPPEQPPQQPSEHRRLQGDPHQLRREVDARKAHDEQDVDHPHEQRDEQPEARDEQDEADLALQAGMQGIPRSGSAPTIDPDGRAEDGGSLSEERMGLPSGRPQRNGVGRLTRPSGEAHHRSRHTSGQDGQSCGNLAKAELYMVRPRFV